jgi:predicted Zn-dependent protease
MTEDPAAEFARARMLAGMGQVAEAVRVLDPLLEADPSHQGALLLRAALHAEEREWDQALEMNQRAARLWPR